jgi:uncharacterized protein Usg
MSTMRDLDLRPTAVSFDRYCQATAEIIYRLPDHPALLQSFVWQHLDMAPDFPVLRRFLDYWEEYLDGPIHSVRVERHRLIDPRQLRHASHLMRLQ